MPDISTGSQIFDLCFAPNAYKVYSGLLSGHIKGFSYDEQGQHEELFSLRPSKKSCRGLAISSDGTRLWAVGKSKSLITLNLETGDVSDTRAGVHDSPINRVHCLRPHTLSTGDDDGVIKLWDTRKPEAIRTYTHHFDFISDFLWLEEKKQLVTTSGDGSLSVIDIRSNKAEPFAHSEDQEDELLSIVPIRGGSKYVVGTQQGILSVFNRASGWGDCVDRIPGHPHSIDALCTLPSSYPSAHSTILTGSSDGLLRAVQLYPTKLLGAIADHGDFPIERVRVDMNGEGRWVGSVGHEEIIKLTDLRGVFEDDKEDEERGEDERAEEDSDEDSDENSQDDESDAMLATTTQSRGAVEKEEEGHSNLSAEAPKVVNIDSDDDLPKEKKRKRKEADPLNIAKRKKGKDQMEADASFFSGL